MVGDAPFAVLLPDVLVDQYQADLTTTNLAAMVRNFESSGASQIMVEPVAWEDVSKYGVVDCLGEELVVGGTSKINGMVEKPNVDAAPSNMAVVGRYVLPSSLWQLLENTRPGAGGEIQLTDAIDELLKIEQVDAYRIEGKSHDCGNKLGYMKAQVEYAIKHEEIGQELEKYITSLDKATTNLSPVVGS